MSFWQHLMLVVAVLSLIGPAWNWTAGRLGFPRLPWNATGIALGLGYFAGQALYLAEPTRQVPDMLDEMFMIDLAVISLIFCKAIARCPDEEYRSGWHQLACMVRAFTPCDRIVLGIYPLMWVAYVATLDDFARWWVLYGLAMIQFAAAGAEALLERRRAKASDSEPDIPSSGLMYAVARAGRWST